MEKYFTSRTETFFVLVTDNKARLVFYSQDSAEKYLNTHNHYENTSIQKVYGETKIIEVVN